MLEAPATLTAPLPTPTSAPRAAIGSVAYAVPSRVVGNEAIASQLDVDEAWIVERTGVRQRRIAGDGEDLVGLATAAGMLATKRAATAPQELDLVLAATMSHDRLTPNLAPLVADRIGARAAGALDVGAACTGFLAGLGLAGAQVEAGRAETVLVIGADQLSRLTDPLDRSTAALFADGAGAVVVRAATQGAGIGPVVLGSDGSRGGLVCATREEAVIRMEGQDTFREAVARLSEATLAAAAEAGAALEQIDAFVYHQANARILRAVAQRLRLPGDRVVECISSYGNTSAASIPIALATAVERGLLRSGGLALLGAFGGGLTWGATVVEWEAGG